MCSREHVSPQLRKKGWRILGNLERKASTLPQWDGFNDIVMGEGPETLNRDQYCKEYYMLLY